MKLRYAARTDVGLKRDHNEDCFAVIDEERLFVVADGMGGHASGEVAAKLAADTLAEFFQHTRDEDATWPYKMDRLLSYPENRLVCGIKLANLRIYEAAQRDESHRGMGTTIVTAFVEGDRIYLAHVGDSRAYRIRDGEIEPLTRDHSLLEEFRLAKPDMTEAEVRNFPHKNVITRALGMRDSVQVDVRPDTIRGGDTYLLCCDGLSGMVPDPELLALVQRGPGLEEAAAELVAQANRAGGVDNITVILLRCEETGG